jgi:hypothetical protein
MGLNNLNVGTGSKGLLTLSGSSAALTLTNSVYVGRTVSEGTQLLLSNGALLTSREVSLEGWNGTSNARFIVDDARAYLNFAQTRSSEAQFVVTNGATVVITNSSTFALRIANADNTGNSGVFVGGAKNGKPAALIIQGSSARITIGASAASTRNNYLIVGSGGVVTNAHELRIGNSATTPYNYLSITNGGFYRMGSDATALGYGNHSRSNYVYVCGKDSNGVRATYDGNNGKTINVGSASNTSHNVVFLDKGGAMLRTVLNIGGAGSAGTASFANGVFVSNGGYFWPGTRNNPSEKWITVGPYVNSSNNFLVVTGDDGEGNPSLCDLGGSQLLIGPGLNNSITVANGGAITNINAFRFDKSMRSSLIVTNGGLFAMGAESFTLGYGGLSEGCSVYVGGRKGSVPATIDCGPGKNMNIGGTSALDSFSSGHSVIVDKGGLITNVLVRVGVGTACSNNWLTVKEEGIVALAGPMAIGNTHANPPVDPRLVNSCGNGIKVTGPGSLAHFFSGTSGDRHLHVGLGYNNISDNKLIVEQQGCVYNANTLFIGISSNSVLTANNYNTVEVTSRGLLDIAAITISAANNLSIGNRLMVTNNGVLQFSTGTPQVTINNKNSDPSAGNSVVFSNSVLSYRATVNPWANTNSTTGIGTFDWLGENTLRVDNAQLRCGNNVAYTFQKTADPRNFVRLEMINGVTGCQAGHLTIGETGSLMVSNTVAAIAGTEGATPSVLNLTVNGGLEFYTDVASQTKIAVNGALTLNTTNATVYLTGEINGQKIELFSYGTAGTMDFSTWKIETNKSVNPHPLKVVAASNKVMLVEIKGTMIQFL